MITVPAYLPPYVLSGTVAIVAAVLVGLHRALKRAGWPDRDRRHAFLSVAVLLVGGTRRLCCLPGLNSTEVHARAFPRFSMVS